MLVNVQRPLFAWDSLEDSPSLGTVKRLLKAIPDARLLEGLRLHRGRGRNDYLVTSANVGDGETLPALLAQARANLPEGRIRTLAYDKAADSNEVHRTLDQAEIQPLFQIRSLWKDQTEQMLPGHDGRSNIVYDEAGTVYCYDRTSQPIVRPRRPASRPLTPPSQRKRLGEEPGGIGTAHTKGSRPAGNRASISGMLDLGYPTELGCSCVRQNAGLGCSCVRQNAGPANRQRPRSGERSSDSMLRYSRSHE